jgi:hypothetical protein
MLECGSAGTGTRPPGDQIRFSRGSWTVATWLLGGLVFERTLTIASVRVVACHCVLGTISPAYGLLKESASLRLPLSFALGSPMCLASLGGQMQYWPAHRCAAIAVRSAVSLGASLRHAETAGMHFSAGSRFKPPSPVLRLWYNLLYVAPADQAMCAGAETLHIPEADRRTYEQNEMRQTVGNHSCSRHHFDPPGQSVTLHSAASKNSTRRKKSIAQFPVSSNSAKSSVSGPGLYNV